MKNKLLSSRGSIKRYLWLFLAVCLLLTGCAPAVQKADEQTHEFVDSCGRSVQVPDEIEKIVPSGSYAQIVLYTLCPEKVISLSSALSRTQKQYLDESWQSLPVTGQFYGGGNTVNYEEIIQLNPDIIIDIGEKKTNIADDMDELQEKTGIAVVFIEADIDSLAEAYDTLGELLHVEEQGSALASYIRETLNEAKEKTALLSEKTRTMYAQGEFGTEVLGVGSVHSEVLAYAGAENVAVVDGVASKGGNEVSLEQIYLWNPDVILLSADANYEEIYDDPLWATVSAVQNGRVYEVPEGPYCWLDRPPSVQRILGIKWLENLLYPELFPYDMIAETQEFYRLFWHYELSEQEARELLKNSTFCEEAE